jgi:hypothetical protein
MEPPPPPPPPQWSRDGLFWWDGYRWIHRGAYPPDLSPPPPPLYPVSTFLKPSPGLRIALIVALALEVALSGLFAVAFVAGASQQRDAFSYALGFELIATFLLSLVALVAVIVRTAWSRWVAIAAGIIVSLTCLGLVLGIPIVITSARAPDLAPSPT